ncbi:MFS transporter [Candidatus Rickettsia colombianensi]|uniref:MFS transporter n=1 Tax=Candidatus Rickettsia colombianensi TaxID=1090944 RepID=UPI00319E7B95
MPVGASAAWIVTICRIVQGMSSMGERVGAELYLTESVGVPKRFPAVAFVGVCASLGLTVALGVTTLVTSYGFNWRIAFWVGAGIALIGSAARTTLRETPDFVDAKRRIQETIKDSNIIDVAKIKNNPVWQEKVNKKTAIYYFLIQLAQPVWFYFAYIHCSNIL